MRGRLLFLASIAILSVGCSNELETGYKPQSLGASSAVRRSYYASPFTPESHAADQERDAEFQARHPRPGY
ncbi:MAG: hypothetical protein JO353_13765 [Phycisphaerae bacterium]|nr:hypothetical protein [Phycisphaerae bacterium]